MEKIKTTLKIPRVIILLIFLLIGIFAINPNPWKEGVAIKAVAKNSSAELAGIQNPKSTLAPMGYERIIAINNKAVENLQDYYTATSTLEPNDTLQIKTNKATYRLTAKPKTRTTELNETELQIINETTEEEETINNTTTKVNKTTEKTIERKKTITEIIGVEPLGMSVDNAPKSNLRKGLDLQGGTRILLKPAEETNRETIGLMIDSLKERLNVYGLGDVVVTEATDSPDFLGGKSFILVEMAGASEEEAKELLGKQGKFEAKIANKTVFQGGKDITYVCRTAQCSGINPNSVCEKKQEVWSCGFMFSITLNPEAAERQAKITEGMKIIENSLSEQLVLYLDDKEVDRLSIAADLRGRAVTDIAITGGGNGASEKSAIDDTLQKMKRLQTVLITGSLPIKLEIEKIDTISPTLGKEFLKNALIVGLLALIGVATALVIAYRRILIAITVIFTAVSEVFLTLSMAALIGWNIDIAAIAGLILAVGTGVDDQIVITDEAIKGDNKTAHNWKERIRRAFFIIFSAYLTLVVAMIPLLFAGAGLLKGFAITTILAVTIGVLITRPAYAAIVETLVEK